MERWVVSFMPWLLYPSYLLHRKLGGPQSWSGYCREEKNSLAPALNQNWFLGLPGQRLVTDWTISSSVSHYMYMLTFRLYQIILIPTDLPGRLCLCMCERERGEHMCVHMCMCTVYAVHDVCMNMKFCKEGTELFSEVIRMYDQNMN
jgi:hypothetical protein